MTKMLTRFDGKLFLEVDQSMIEHLRISEGTPLDVHNVEGGWMVEPKKETREERFRRAMEEVNERYAETFRRLAE